MYMVSHVREFIMKEFFKMIFHSICFRCSWWKCRRIVVGKSNRDAGSEFSHFITGKIKRYFWLLINFWLIIKLIYPCISLGSYYLLSWGLCQTQCEAVSASSSSSCPPPEIQQPRPLIRRIIGSLCVLQCCYVFIDTAMCSSTLLCVHRRCN